MANTPEQATVTLPERLDRSATIEFKATLDQHLGANLSIDGSGLEIIGGLGLQLLHQAKQHWHESGWDLEITSPSEPLEKALSWLEPAQQEDIGDLS